MISAINPLLLRDFPAEKEELIVQTPYPVYVAVARSRSSDTARDVDYSAEDVRDWYFKVRPRTNIPMSLAFLRPVLIA